MEPKTMRPCTVLVAEDEEHSRDLYQEGLEEAGFCVRLARDGVEALDQIQKGGIEAMVLDIKMPRMHGLAVLEELRLMDCHIPVVLASAYQSMWEDCSVNEYSPLGRIS